MSFYAGDGGDGGYYGRTFKKTTKRGKKGTMTPASIDKLQKMLWSRMGDLEDITKVIRDVKKDPKKQSARSIINKYKLSYKKPGTKVRTKISKMTEEQLTKKFLSLKSTKKLKRESTVKKHLAAYLKKHLGKGGAMRKRRTVRRVRRTKRAGVVAGNRLYDMMVKKGQEVQRRLRERLRARGEFY